MDAPKCRLCQERHYGLCPSFAVLGERARKVETGEAREHRGRVLAVGIAPATLTSGPVSKPKFDKTAYQKEYMRKRRAAKRINGSDPHSS